MSTHSIESGTRVRFKSDQLGLMASIGDNHFAPEIAMKGDEGTYEGPHPQLQNWHIVAVQKDGRELYCPCYEGMFEVVDP